ncbi:MAG: hypothetical protein AAFP08_07250 [Bacteroidota bacterium]
MRPFLFFGLLFAHLITLSATSIFDLIEAGEETRELTLFLPMDSIYAKSNEKQDAWLSFTDETGLAQRWSLHVGVRGKFRRRTCSLPPLKLDFDKGDLEEAGLSRHDKLKLVVPCQEGELYQNLVLREYLAYQVYAEVTPYHFRTKLVEIKLIDSNGNHPDAIMYAFLLEDADEMAERIGGEEIDNLLGLSADAWNREAEITHSLAQYLLGNHDYSLGMVRNLKQVRLHSTGELVPVAYDFDFSLLVSAPYATLNTAVGQVDFSDRVYLGLPDSDEQIGAVIERFEALRRNLVRDVRQNDLLAYDDRNRIANSLVSAFNELRRAYRANNEESIYTRLSGLENTALQGQADVQLGRE